jgi:hypothetical protein
MAATHREPNYSEVSRCVLSHARDAARDALLDLARTDVSPDASDPRRRPEYWVGHLQYLLGYLLIAMEQSES